MALNAYRIFKIDPFDPRLGTHPIARLSSRLRRQIYSVEIGPDLRAVFYREGNTIMSLDIGTHAIYK